MFSKLQFRLKQDTLIDPTTFETIRIPLSISPGRIAISPDGNFAYVASAELPDYESSYVKFEPEFRPNGRPDTISIIDTRSKTEVDTIGVQYSDRAHLAITLNGNQLYVTKDTNEVALIDTASRRVIDNIRVGNSPVGIAIAHTLCLGQTPTIIGTDGNDRLIGTLGDDVIMGLGGNDFIKGKAGNDVICGGLGDDVIRGGHGNDELSGGRGNDRLFGGEGSDILFGGKGDDQLSGGNGYDAAVGGSGIDGCDRSTYSSS